MRLLRLEVVDDHVSGLSEYARTELEETGAGTVVGHLEIVVETLEVSNVDSSNIDAQIWSQLASTIKERYDEYESFIVIHGTNTLGYTCAALSFALANPAKPVILTASQVPCRSPRLRCADQPRECSTCGYMATGQTPNQGRPSSIWQPYHCRDACEEGYRFRL